MVAEASVRYVHLKVLIIGDRVTVVSRVADPVAGGEVKGTVVRVGAEIVST